MLRGSTPHTNLAQEPESITLRRVGVSSNQPIWRDGQASRSLVHYFNFFGLPYNVKVAQQHDSLLHLDHSRSEVSQKCNCSLCPHVSLQLC